MAAVIQCHQCRLILLAAVIQFHQCRLILLTAMIQCNQCRLILLATGLQCQRAFELMGQQGRWQEGLQEYNFDIKHRSGSKHGNADALSSRPCGKPGCYQVEINMMQRRKQEQPEGVLQAVVEIFNEVCGMTETDAAEAEK